MKWVGQPIPRLRDPVLLKGKGRFTADIAVGAMAIRFVRSPVARGTICGIEIPEGAVVFTAADITDIKPLRPILHGRNYVPTDQPILANKRVTYVGEPVAAVIAATQSEAEDIAEQVMLDIDVLDPAIDVDEALKPDAPRVHDQAPGNVLVETSLKTPGFDAVWAKAAQVVEVDIRSRRQNAMPMETRNAHAVFDHSTGRVTLYTSVQNPHPIRTGIADVLGMPETDLRVVAPDVGGGFGQKMALVPEYVFAVWVARKLEASVAWIEDRNENLIASFHSRDQHHTVKAAFDENAKLIALEADLRCNVGAYSNYPITCGVEPLMAMSELPGPYDLREYSVRTRGVTTNTCPMAPYRGVSRPVLTLSMERIMNLAADRFGLDPVEMRRRNLITEFPYKTVTGSLYDAGTYWESLERSAEVLDLKGFRERQKKAREEGRYLGIGFSVFNERSGYGTPTFAARGMEITPGYETVEMAMDPSGYVIARIGASPHGQGLETGLSQIIADELGIEPSRIRIISGDTDATPYGWGTFASRSLVLAGGASKLAAEQMRERLNKIAGHLLQAPPEEIELAGGVARRRGHEGSVEITALARAAHHQSQLFGGGGPGLTTIATYDPAGTFSNACHSAIVEVDIETGHVKIERFLVVEDAGILINPMIVDGQIHGGVVQGIANALFEEIIYDETGNILTGSLMDFIPPTMSEVPTIEIEHLETLTDASITKAKGIGEGGTIGPPAAIINAISDALKPFGVEIFEIPATPPRIRQLIREAAKEKS